MLQICFNHTKYCEEWMLPNEEDTTWTPEMEAEYVKVSQHHAVTLIPMVVWDVFLTYLLLGLYFMKL